MISNSLQVLPFHNLNDSQFYTFLRLDEVDILNQNTQLSDYAASTNFINSVDELNFSYLTDMEFNNKVHMLKDNIELLVIHFNIRSLNCNHRALCQFLELLVLKFDIIILSEIWSVNIDFYHNISPGYSFHYDLPKDSQVGGVGVYISDSFTKYELAEYKIAISSLNRIENIWFEVSRYGKKYIIGGIYRHPNQNIQDFTSTMEDGL